MSTDLIFSRNLTVGYPPLNLILGNLPNTVDMTPVFPSLTVAVVIQTNGIVVANDGTMSFTGYAPVIDQSGGLRPNVTSISLAGKIPYYGWFPTTGSITISGPVPVVGGVLAGAGTITFSSGGPIISQSLSFSEGDITITGYLPGISQAPSVVMGYGTMSFTGYAPVLVGILPSDGVLSIGGYSPILFGDDPSTGSITITGEVPTVGGVVSGVGTITITGYAIKDNLVPDRGVMVFSTGSPTIDQSDELNVGYITLTGEPPLLNTNITVPVDGVVSLAGEPPIMFGKDPQAGLLPLTGYAISINGPVPNQGVMTFTGYLPTIGGYGSGVGIISITGVPPSVVQSIALDVGLIVLTGPAPDLMQATSFIPDPGIITLTGEPPNVLQELALLPGLITLTGESPVVQQQESVLPDPGLVIITGEPPDIGQPVPLLPGVGTIVLTGEPPGVIIGGIVQLPTVSPTYAIAQTFKPNPIGPVLLKTKSARRSRLFAGGTYFRSIALGESANELSITIVEDLTTMPVQGLCIVQNNILQPDEMVFGLGLGASGITVNLLELELNWNEEIRVELVGTELHARRWLLDWRTTPGADTLVTDYGLVIGEQLFTIPGVVSFIVSFPAPLFPPGTMVVLRPRTHRYPLVTLDAIDPTTMIDAIGWDPSELRATLNGTDTWVYMPNRPNSAMVGTNEDVNDTMADTTFVTAFGTTPLAGGDGLPSPAGLNTGPERVLILLNYSEAFDGSLGNMNKVFQWQGSTAAVGSWQPYAIP